MKLLEFIAVMVALLFLIFFLFLYLNHNMLQYTQYETETVDKWVVFVVENQFHFIIGCLSLSQIIIASRWQKVKKNTSKWARYLNKIR
jgi:uncharacterized membrane protein YozB (DUF420 family)